jgi:hypothetical protein
LRRHAANYEIVTNKKTQFRKELGCDDLKLNYLRRRIIAKPRPPMPIKAMVVGSGTGAKVKPWSKPVDEPKIGGGKV